MDLIVVGGAPGVGKSTLAKALAVHLGSPCLEFSSLRQPHLDATWSNASPSEHDMAWQNLEFIIRNYIRHGYSDVVLTDLREERIQQVPSVFSDLAFRIVTLFMREDSDLRRRISDRVAGFVDVEAALAWNRLVRDREPVVNETKVEVDGISAEKLVERAAKVLRG